MKDTALVSDLIQTNNHSLDASLDHVAATRTAGAQRVHIQRVACEVLTSEQDCILFGVLDLWVFDVAISILSRTVVDKPRKTVESNGAYGFVGTNNDCANLC